MNSILQCFCHIEKFVEFFKYSTILKNENNKFSSSFKILIDNLWPNDFNPSSPEFNKYYSPIEFINKISKMNPLFENISINDDIDLINFIIMTLHLELNKNIEVNENKIKEIIDQANKELVFQTFNEQFTKKNNSIISELFYSINYNIIQCCNCKKLVYDFQVYYFINFPLNEVLQYKKEKIIEQENNYYMNNIQNKFNYLKVNPKTETNINLNEVDIYDCFDYEEKINYLLEENQIYCNYCRLNSNCYLKTNLFTGPEVLILILNKEFDIKIYFTEELDLSKYIERKETGYIYNLIGVISHLNESSVSRLFIAYCKDPLNGKWYKYNDAIVDEVNDFKKEVIDFAKACVLFYEKI